MNTGPGRAPAAVLQAIKAQLREQGVPVLKVSLYGYVDTTEDDSARILTSTMSPRKSGGQSSGGGLPLPQTPEEDPGLAAQAHKARMAQSNVSFA